MVFESAIVCVVATGDTPVLCNFVQQFVAFGVSIGKCNYDVVASQILSSLPPFEAFEQENWNSSDACAFS